MISSILSIDFSAMMRTFLSSFFCFSDENPRLLPSSVRPGNDIARYGKCRQCIRIKSIISASNEPERLSNLSERMNAFPTNMS